MRFQTTLNLATNNGKPTHQVIFDHPARDLMELRDAMANEDFLYVDEIHKVGEVSRTTGYISRGPMLLETFLMGKTREFVEETRG